MSTWARIHWKVHDLSNAPMENRSELIFWVSPIFPSLMASRADLQFESTMMPSELAIFVRVRRWPSYARFRFHSYTSGTGNGEFLTIHSKAAMPNRQQSQRARGNK
ncbi:uncharacterized protein TNCV_1418991 [Trichonephila clavipes]|nr:uncharacterized protein TNCV_1418991 [Trichonephila clavipes]